MTGTLLKTVSAEEAVSHLKSGMNVFIHGAAATPTPLLDAMCRRTDLTGLKLYHLHVEGPAPFLEPECQNRITSISLFTGQSTRRAISDTRRRRRRTLCPFERGRD